MKETANVPLLEPRITHSGIWIYACIYDCDNFDLVKVVISLKSETLTVNWKVSYVHQVPFRALYHQVSEKRDTCEENWTVPVWTEH